jgi:hypothetical protein
MAHVPVYSRESAPGNCQCYALLRRTAAGSFVLCTETPQDLVNPRNHDLTSPMEKHTVCCSRKSAEFCGLPKPCHETEDRLCRHALLLLSADRGRPVTLLRSVVAKLCVVTAGDLHEHRILWQTSQRLFEHIA